MADPIAETETPYKPTFDEAYPEVAILVARRRTSWDYVTLMPWEDVQQELLLRVYNKWHLYDAAQPLENWVNTLITRMLLNLRRDLLLRWARPCIGGWNGRGKRCEYNLGDDACAFTKSKTQCAECPVYRDWQKAREAQLHLKSTVTLENHAQEVSNIQGDFTDSNEIKGWVDKEMVKELNRWEGKVYRLLFVHHLPPAVVSERLILSSKTRKRPLRPDEGVSYQAVLAYQREFKGMMRELLRRGGYID